MSIRCARAKLLTKAITINFVICIGLEYIGRRRFRHLGRLESSPDEKRGDTGLVIACLCCTLSINRNVVQLTF